MPGPPSMPATFGFDEDEESDEDFALPDLPEISGLKRPDPEHPKPKPTLKPDEISSSLNAEAKEGPDVVLIEPPSSKKKKRKKKKKKKRKAGEEDGGPPSKKRRREKSKKDKKAEEQKEDLLPGMGTDGENKNEMLTQSEMLARLRRKSSLGMSLFAAMAELIEEKVLPEDFDQEGLFRNYDDALLEVLEDGETVSSQIGSWSGEVESYKYYANTWSFVVKDMVMKTKSEMGFSETLRAHRIKITAVDNSDKNRKARPLSGKKKRKRRRKGY